MKLLLATSNKKKVEEIKLFLPNYDFIAYSEVMEPFDIVEDGESFKENSIIKAKAIFDRLDSKDYSVLADDSGISIDAFDGEPGVYSARFAGEYASDSDNRLKVIKLLNEKGLSESLAHYTASISLMTSHGLYTAHGWMYGKVINEVRGSNGFGYDPIFIPDGFDKTLGELPFEVKLKLSHRSKALKNIAYIIEALNF